MQATHCARWLLLKRAWKMGMGTQLSVTIKRLGLEISISDILPRMEHKNYIVKCTTEREWEDLCSALKKKDKDAYNNSMKKSPKMWSKPFLGTTFKSDIVDNNLCEAFNSSIVEARFKSIIRMLEDIRTKMMTRIFDPNKKDCVEWQLIWNGENGRELRKGSYQHIVDLS
ncbi:hypothetical protein CXB51_005778 [Gossypium anomalum]|uniref:Uncharacterized protein n=1 Tax=Gossypium anomalum TaxID=47600 RepID=A0A8J5ZI73_9ROSI|nr:hypothetical protein CXB51_005778 [Gossypium anomalum]